MCYSASEKFKKTKQYLSCLLMSHEHFFCSHADKQKKTLAHVSSSWLRDICGLPHISQVPGVKISPKTEKNQTCSFDRVQEIKVYISFCVLYVSELSGFGSRVGVGGGQWFPAGSYQRRLPQCRHRGGSHLYHLCFARPPLYLGLMWGSFYVHTEALRRGRSTRGRWPKNPPPVRPSWRNFKQVKSVVFVALLLLLSTHLFCGILLTDPDTSQRSILQPSHVSQCLYICSAMVELTKLHFLTRYN